MSERLLEDSSLAVDLRALYGASMFGGAVADTVAADSVTSAGSFPTESVRDAWEKWQEAFNKVIANTANSGKSDYEVERDFFKVFYERNWQADIAAQLLAIGEPLMRAVKLLGFKPTRGAKGNPILAFVLQDFVQTNLLRPKLLNSDTFKAIYNAVAKHYVADSEFFSVNSYNIIYCPDLYKKEATEMQDYLAIQKEILKPSVEKYDMALQQRNKKVFLYTSEVEEPNTVKRVAAVNNYIAKVIKKTKKFPPEISSVRKGVLNSLTIAKALKGNVLDDFKPSSTPEQQLDFINKIDSPAKIFATIQYLSLTTDSENATAALANDKLSGISTNLLQDATKFVKQILAKKHFTTKTADAIVDKLLSKL